MPKLFNLKDQKIGDLVVKEYLGYDKYNNRYWLCECTCGKQVKIRSTILTSGKKTHCGCKNYLKLNLINQKFGYLTVKEFAGRDKWGSYLWLCECTCGNTVTVATKRLTTGEKTHCGCKSKRKQNLINQKYGDLTVKEIVETSKWDDKLLLCECTCGNTIKVMSSLLKSGVKTHCGCKNQIFKDQEVKKEKVKEVALKEITTTYNETKITGYHEFKICKENFLSPFSQLEVLAKKKLILKLTQEVLEKATRHSTLDLFLAFLTGQ